MSIRTLTRTLEPSISPARSLLALLSLTATLLSLLFTPSPAHAQPISRPVHERRLANGLRVFISPDPAGSDVSILIRYDTGSRDEPTGLEGLAHLVEHLMFLGSKHVPPGKHAELLEQAGGTRWNGETSLDGTVYHETLPPERLALGLWLESDRMGYLLDRTDERALSQARAEVQNERRGRVVEQPLGSVPEIMFAELFPAWHPYHHMPVGSQASIDRIRLDDVRAWVRTWYGPANATLFLAGKVDPAGAMALVERYFGSLPANAPPARPALPKLERKTSTFLQVAAGVIRSEVHLAWVTPAFGAPGDAELDLFAAILASRGAGWLEKRLLAAPRLCTGVSATQHSFERASVFEIEATVAEGRDVQQVIATIQASLASFEAELRDTDVRRAQRSWYAGRLFGLESSLGWASRLDSQARVGPVPAAFDGRLGTYAAISPDGVRAAVRASLAHSPAVITVAYPSRVHPTAGVLLQRTDVTR